MMIILFDNKQLIFLFLCCSQTNEAPFSRPPTLQDYSSDGDTEDE